MKIIKFKKGDQVLVLNEDRSSLEEGDIGIITEVDEIDDCAPYKVTVIGKDNKGNWMMSTQLQLIKR